MTRYRLLALAAVLIAGLTVLPGCPYDEYTIELTPKGDRLHRTLTIKHMPGVVTAGKAPEPSAPQLDEAVTKTINQAYGGEPTEKNGLPHWAGTFGPDLPDDLGGTSGHYLRYESSLGSACIYAESFRGTNDAYGHLQMRFKGADAVVGIARGFLRQELGEIEGFETLDGFLDKTFRRDLKTLAVYAWQLSNVHVGPGMALDETDAHQSLFKDKSEAAGAGASMVLARSLMFLAEENYIDRQTLPMLPRLEEGAASLMRHLLTQKVKLPIESPLIEKFIAMTKAPEALGNKVQSYIWTTEEWQAAAKAVGHDPLTEDLEARAEIERQWARSTGLAALDPKLDSLMPGNDRLTLTLHATGLVMANMTNGSVSRDGQTISWSGQMPAFSVDSKYYSLPLLCHAAWTEPDVAAQKKHFGRAVLEDEHLLEYSLWVNGLTDTQRQQWEAYLATITPETALEKLMAFPAAPNDLWHAEWREEFHGMLETDKD